MGPVSFAAEKKKSVSKDWLLGLTVGAYATLAVAFYFFGGGTWISSHSEEWDYYPSGQLGAFVLLIPGLLIGLLDFVQIHPETVFKHHGSDRMTAISVRLNAAAIIGFFAVIPLNSMNGAMVGYVQGFAALAVGLSFCLGIGAGLVHVLWIMTKSWKSPKGSPN